MEFGGTIARKGRGPLDLIEYASHEQVVSAGELLESIPEISSVAEVEVLSLRQGLGTDVDTADWLNLVDTLDRLSIGDPDVSGFVVTHGTATIEETAYFLHLCLKTSATVVITGSLRPPTGYSSDAALNLYHAVMVAACPGARSCGVLVVMDQTIHAAREVRKASKYRLAAFVSPGWGPLGYVDHDIVVMGRRANSSERGGGVFEVVPETVLPRVDICYSYVGSDGAAIGAFLAAGAKGIVSASFAPGGETPGDMAAMRRALDAGVHVIRSSRADEGRVLARVGDPLIAAGDLSPAKARVLSMLGLLVSDDRQELQEMFDRY